MCGIVGCVSKEQLSNDEMLDALRHRGPDNRGSYEDMVQGKYCYLGHSRLSIIDLSKAGNQPMFSQDKSVVISYNGEVYNFQDLKKRFLKNYEFNSNTDTEVILKLYLEFGIEFINHLNGDFAISILDKRLKKLYVIRDRMGVKPLYYYHKNQDYVFASEIKSILKSGIKAEMNFENLEDYFVFKYVPEQETLFKGINRVPPAHYHELDLNTGVLNQNCYWEPKFDIGINKTSFSHAQADLKKLIRDATEMRLISDVPLGTFFSGGLDSSIIASFLKDKSGIKHYCAVKSEEDLRKEGTTSDAYYARKIASDWGLNVQEISIGAKELNLDLIRTTLKYSEDLIADGSQIPSYLITKMAAQSSTVILSGMGADELFLGYAGHQLLLLDSYLMKLPKSVRSLLFSIFRDLNVGKGSFKAYKRYLKKLGEYYLLDSDRFGLYNVVGDYFSAKSVIKKEYRQDRNRVISKYFNSKTDPFESLKKYERNNFLVKNLHYTDRMSMANSVENRVPFLDHRVVEYAYSLPTSYKMNAFGRPKHILKEAFKEDIPKGVLSRRKAGFGMPLRSLLGNKRQLDNLLDREFFNSFDYFSAEGIEEVIKSHLNGEKDNSALLYALISFQEWYKMYID